MSQELIYTSVPRGLKPGSKGFCTVAQTADLSAQWVERLESLSAYRPVFPLGDPSASKNPVIWAHWRANVAGRMRSVLSRVAFAGVDYSQRSNKFAHHLVLEPAEQAAGGPAWVMLQPEVMERKWSREPGLLPAGRVLPQADRPRRPCSAWAAVAGDAGWAGVLAEAFFNAPSKPAYLIFEPGTDVLPLIDEALDLLPADKRWQVTFSTYFTELPAGLTCAWRAVVAGTSGAKEALRSTGTALVIDLTRQLGAAQSGLADAARDGTPSPVIAQLRPAMGLLARESEPTQADGLEHGSRGLAEDGGARSRRRLAAREPYELVEDTGLPDETPTPRRVPVPPIRAGSRISIVLVVAVVVVGLSLVVAVFIVVGARTNLFGDVFNHSRSDNQGRSGATTRESATVPLITQKPADAKCNDHETVSFTVQAAGTPAPTVQWKRKKHGSSDFVDLAGGTSPTLQVGPVTLDDNDDQYQAVLRGGAGAEAKTEPATLKVIPAAPSVTVQPKDVNAVDHDTVSFAAQATGTPTPAVQWKRKKHGASDFLKLDGKVSTPLQVGPVSLDDNDDQYQAVFRSGAGPEASTEPVTLKVTPAAPVVSQQPQKEVACLDSETVTITTAATGTPTPTVQWTRKKHGTNEFEIMGHQTGSTLQVGPVTLDDNDDQYRAVFRSGAGPVTKSDVVKLTVSPLPVEQTPNEALVEPGKTGTSAPLTAIPSLSEVGSFQVRFPNNESSYELGTSGPRLATKSVQGDSGRRVEIHLEMRARSLATGELKPFDVPLAFFDSAANKSGFSWAPPQDRTRAAPFAQAAWSILQRSVVVARLPRSERHISFNNAAIVCNTRDPEYDLDLAPGLSQWTSLEFSETVQGDWKRGRADSRSVTYEKVWQPQSSPAETFRFTITSEDIAHSGDNEVPKPSKFVVTLHWNEQKYLDQYNGAIKLVDDPQKDPTWGGLNDKSKKPDTSDEKQKDLKKQADARFDELKSDLTLCGKRLDAFEDLRDFTVTLRLANGVEFGTVAIKAPKKGDRAQSSGAAPVFGPTPKPPKGKNK